MIDKGKHSVLGVMVDATDYESVVARTIAAAEAGQPLSVTALAVHGVMTGHLDLEHRSRLNQLDMVLPDGQPVRWALNALHGAGLRERVYGPELMLKILEDAQRRELGVYLYGSTEHVLEHLTGNLRARFPALRILGAEPSRFRRLTLAEKADVVQRIRRSGARITFVGLGCPRQEVWAYEYRDNLSMPVVAVGAAFDFHAGLTPQAPAWMQHRGLEWLFRLKTEPRRLWGRYIVLNPRYVALILAQWLGARQFPMTHEARPTEMFYG